MGVGLPVKEWLAGKAKSAVFLLMAQLFHHLIGHPYVASIKGIYADAVVVHVVMEGG